MSTASPSNKIEVGSVSDRGLSEKRPLNEDSYLVDAARGIFVVADGVGGAEAGEVASQTAVDVLDDAFQHKVNDGDDVEDLMELAIQRANNSIHQMAQDNPRFSMMATTVVALHVDGNRATIGHVGDSRLYRLSPDGELHRETNDHSIVEEEVRAGRMTPEQAANHPSKNVISRALGAEETVEADMKVIDVEDGSAFLLCTDGITRHLPDPELRELLTSEGTPAQLCEEMKRRCYQRGAEDNLTAVVVQVGTPKFDRHPVEDESTVSLELEPTEVPAAPLAAVAADNSVHLTPASRIAFPPPSTVAPTVNAPAVAQTTKRGGRGILRFLLLLLFIGMVGAAFYAGMIYQRQKQVTRTITNAQPSPSPPSTLATGRAEVDADPSGWLNSHSLGNTSIADRKDPEFLYLFGRAKMLSGDHRAAIEAFDVALNNLRTDRKNELPLETEVKLADAAAALKLNQESPAQSQQSSLAEQKALNVLDDLLGTKPPNK
jgi:serine/threonine protein phosphatase PrpC